MKQVIHKTGSISMALLVLLSTMSFTVEKHFCGSMLVDQAVFSQAETCGMEMPSEQEETEDEASCCKQEKVVVEGQSELKFSFADLDWQHQAFITSFAFSYVDLFRGLPEQVIPFKDYSPPLLVTDIQLLDQAFLI